MGLGETRIQVLLRCTCSDVNWAIICIKCGLQPKSIKLRRGMQGPVFLWEQFCLYYSFSVCISWNNLSSFHPLLGELSSQPRQLIAAVRKGVSKQCAYPAYKQLQTNEQILCCPLPSGNHIYNCSLNTIMLVFTLKIKRILLSKAENVFLADFKMCMKL